MDDCARIRDQRCERCALTIERLLHSESLIINGRCTVYITGRRRDVLENAISKFEKQDGFGEIIP